MLQNKSTHELSGVRCSLHALGYPCELEVAGPAAGTGEVLRAAGESWGSSEGRFHGRPLKVRVEVTPGGRPVDSRPRVTVRRGGFALEWDRTNRAEFLTRVRYGRLRVDSGALGRGFRHRFLETLVLSALDSVYFMPLHAACVARDGRAVLLCGDSGSGKSCLTYACARRGWTVIADDAVHLAPSDEPVVAGGSRVIRLREGARKLFPELDGRPAGVAPNGKLSIEAGGAAREFKSERFGVPSQIVFLSRSATRARLDTHPQEAALAYFSKYLWHFDTAAHVRRIARFLEIGARRLEYSDVDEAVDMLEELVKRH